MINTRKNAAIFIIVYFAIFLNKISCNDDEDSNVYSTKDPKYREPSPCEGIQFHFRLNGYLLNTQNKEHLRLVF